MFRTLFGGAINFHKNNTVMNQLWKMKRFVPGNVKVMGWDLDYVDGPALASCIDVLVNKGWNNFQAENDTPTIIDCGSNIGISVLNYKKQYPFAKIIAFEPDPHIIKFLERNLRVNNAEDVVVVNSAVWFQNGEMPFFCEQADGSRIISGNHGKEAVMVKTVDITEYIEKPIDMLKIDIEGAEYEVISHMEDKLALIKNMVIECHLDNSDISGLTKILQVLSSAGFKVAINSYGPWVDLVHRPERAPNGFDQYLLVAAWR